MSEIKSIKDIEKALGAKPGQLKYEQCPHCGRDVSLFGVGLDTMLAGINHKPTHAGCFYKHVASDQWRASHPHYNPES